MKPRMEQIYVAVEEPEPDWSTGKVAAFCDLCGKRLSEPTEAINFDDLLVVVLTHMKEDHP